MPSHYFSLRKHILGFASIADKKFFRHCLDGISSLASSPEVDIDPGLGAWFVKGI